MKTLLVGVILAATMLAGTPKQQLPESPLIEMTIQSELVFQDMVWVYDFNGNLLRELTVKDVASRDITISDYLLLEDSHYAFSYNGDYYYFRD